MQIEGSRIRVALIALVAGALVSCASSPAAYRTVDEAMRGRWAPFPSLSDDDVTFLEATIPPFPSVGASDDGAEYLVFVSADSWELARDVGSALTGLRERVVGRLERVLLHRGAQYERIWFDADSRRLGVALALNAQGWRREGRGRWRSPSGREELLLARRDVWMLVRRIAPSHRPVAAREGADDGHPLGGSGGPPLREETSALYNATVQIPGSRVRVLAWIASPSIPGFPENVGPESALFALNEEYGGGGYLVAHGAIAFASEREARVALVPARLLLPQLVVARGMELGTNFDIIRVHETVVITDVRITVDVEAGVLDTLFINVPEGGAP